MKRSLFVLATLASVAGVAHGQLDTKTNYLPSNVTIRAGGGFAIDQSLNAFSTSYWGVGLDFGYSRGLFKGSELYYSVDYLWGTHKSTDVGFLPIMVNHRFYADHGGDDNRFGQHRLYAVGGLGVTYYQLGGADLKPAAKLGFGVDLNETLSFETNAFLSLKSKNDVTGNLVGFYLGYHFR